MRKWLAMSVVSAVFMLGGVSESLAWRPAGWAYHNGNYLYSPNAAGWLYLNALDEQWIINLGSGIWGVANGMSGWFYHNWPYAYSRNTGTWHWFNTPDAQWILNMTPGVWSLLGVAPAPDGMTTIPHGTNAGTDPDFGVYSLTNESAFYMDKVEVTKALWDEVYTWATTNGYAFDNTGGGKASNHPVHSVNWYDVVKWCNARSEKEGRTPAYTTDAGLTQIYKTGQEDDVHVNPTANGYRLPADSAWEYAARGGASSRRFPWGDTIQHERANYYSDDSFAYDTSPTRGHHSTYNDGTMPYTSPVGSFAANDYGLYDMAGNILEWCFDWYPESSGLYRVARGGTWYYAAEYCRVAWRLDAQPDAVISTGIGLRTILPAQ